MRSRWVVLSSTTAAVAIAVALLLRPSRVSEPLLPAPTHIPPDVRAALRSRMLQHGAQMNALLLDVVLLNRDATARIAGALYDEPPIDRGFSRGFTDASGPEELPARFFTLQAQLRERARALVVAAASNNADEMAERFATLTRTCVLCHEAYLHDDPRAGR